MQFTRERLSIRAALFLGFGLILGLWLTAWAQLSMRIADAQSRASAINGHYLQAQETLSNIRTQVLIASVTFRDALLDPDLTRFGKYRQQLEDTYGALDGLMREYRPFSNSPAANNEFTRLRTEVDAYRASMLDVLASDRTYWQAQARSVLSGRVTPRRDIIIAVSENVQAINRTAFVDHQSGIADVHRTVQSDLWQLLGLALAIGVAIAVLAVVYAGRLERRLRQQMARDVDLAHDLQELSAKLVSAQEQERRHIARELHDEIGQALTAIKVELAVAQRSIEGAQGPTTVLQAARAITDGALHQVRDLSYLLHPAALDEFGLVPAVDAYTKSFASRHEISVELTHHGMGSRLAPETESSAYRIIQEALNNVAKHARATECRVRLERTAEALRIAIEDDGVGFDSTAPRSADRRGLGLIGIRERAAHLNGTVAIDSHRGGGTRIIVELPVRIATDFVGEVHAVNAPALTG
jgi:signal transduction histidine kinase